MLSSSATCSWIFDNYMNDDSVAGILIELSSQSTIDINDPLIINSNAFSFSYSEYFSSCGWISLNNSFIINNIEYPDDIFLPNVVIDIPSTIGTCDELILDARSTSGIGGRTASYLWTILDITSPTNETNNLWLIGMNYSGSYFVITDEIESPALITLQLLVNTWYGTTHLYFYIVLIFTYNIIRYEISVLLNTSVYKSSDAVPIVTLSGWHQYSSTNYDGKVCIQADISFEYNCEDNNLYPQSIDYSLEWSVISVDAIDDDVIVNNATLHKLREYLANDENSNSLLSVYADTYLQPGLLYIFQLTLNCVIGSTYGYSICNETNASHWIWYEYSALRCQISGGNQIMMNIVPDIHLNDYELVLDGDTFTFDPDVDYPMISKSHLHGRWICIKNGVRNCTSLLKRTNNSLKRVLQFSEESQTMENDSTYEYVILLTVSDIEHPDSREECIASTSISITTTADFSSNIGLLTVSIIALKSNIIRSERLRLLSNFVQNSSAFYEYEWSEVNGQISDQSFINNNKNLIISDSVLQRGSQYQFELIVYEFTMNGTLIAEGNALSPIITVYNGPIIIEGSFTIEPNCSDVKQTEYSLSLTADGTYLPLGYQFSYSSDNISTQYLHSTLIADSYIDGVVLPYGEFNQTVTVFDAGLYDTLSYKNRYKQ